MTDNDVTFDGRRDERFETSWLVLIALPGRDPLRVAARDVSRTGARLSVPQSVDLPETFAFQIVGKDFIVQARQVWRRGNYVGITVERTAPLPVPVDRAAKVKSMGPKGRQADTDVQGIASPAGYGNHSSDVRALAMKAHLEREAREAKEVKEAGTGPGSVRMFRDRPDRDRR